MNKLLTYARMLDSLIVGYVQVMIILIEYQEVLREELKCLCSETSTVLTE